MRSTISCRRIGAVRHAIMRDLRKMNHTAGVELNQLIRLVMAKKLRNNQRKTMGLCTTNSTQYIPLCNLVKYIHIYDRDTGFITVKNIRQDRVVGVFDYTELCEHLGIRT